MTLRNQAFYNRNEGRPYPVSDEATGLDDTGARVPSDLVVDLNVSFPRVAAQRAYISALTVTEHLVSLVLLGTSGPSSPASTVPLASIDLPQPVVPYRSYPFRTIYPETVGWVVFGAGVVSPNVRDYAGRFTTPAQTILLPSTTHARLAFPITDIAKLHHHEPLTGLVRLASGNDIEVIRACREVPANPPTTGKVLCNTLDTQARDVIVFRLKESTPAGQPQRNVYDIYSGPCAGRPESFTCGDPEPIEFIGVVPPDCCGNIDLVFRGCAIPSAVTQASVVVDEVITETVTACGVIIDCSLGLDEVCVTPDRLPTATGRLPNEYDDLCESASSVSITLPPEEPEESFNLDEESASVAVDPLLPIVVPFTVVEPLMVVKSGYFEYLAGAFSTENEGGPLLRNLAVWDESFDTFYKKVSARVQILEGFAGNLRNAAVVANYRETSPGSGRFSYYVAEIDWDGYYHGYKLFRIGRFNGSHWNTEFAVPVGKLDLETEYDITLEIFPSSNDPDAAWLIATLKSVADASIDVTIGPLLENNYTPATGRFGVSSNRAAVRFDWFRIDSTGTS